MACSALLVFWGALVIGRQFLRGEQQVCCARQPAAAVMRICKQHGICTVYFARVKAYEFFSAFVVQFELFMSWLRRSELVVKDHTRV